MHRNIYQETKITELQQGCLFWGAIADGYDKPVWGLIITPRCDIAQNKVITVHYLPVTKFTDWKDIHLAAMLQQDCIKKKLNTLKPVFDSKKISESLLDFKYRLSDEDLKTMFEGKQMPPNFFNDLREYWSYHDMQYCRDSFSSWKNYSNRISELVEGKMERFLLLEHWNDDLERYYVIHLTEIKHLQITTAHALIKGIKSNMVNEEDDLMYKNEGLKSQEYRVVAQITSPYIEYVCQKFANAFFRIGIEDWPNGHLSKDLQSL